jgi:guanyl-specific ribonuclease Sa
MSRSWIFIAAPILLSFAAPSRANDADPVLLTVQGTIDKVEKEALTLKPRGVDGKTGKNLVLKLTGASKISMLTMQTRAGKVVIGQKELESEELKPRQVIAAIYRAGSPDQVLLTAVVLPHADRDHAEALPAATAAKVAKVLKHIDEYRAAPDGYEGGRTFLNLGRDGEQALPRRDTRGKPITYHEWDVNARVPGRNRGAERLVTGSDGSAYYTADHYRTFTKIR